MIDNAQYSHRLQDMVSKYNTTLERLKSNKEQLEEFVDASKSANIAQYTGYRCH